MREFAFELSVCARLERNGGLVSRQLGGAVAAPGSRILDVVHVEPGPAFDERAAITPETIPALAIEADLGTGRARYWREAVAGDGEYVREALDRAVEMGFLERTRRGGREYLRQTTRYPDEWFSTITAIENKPDLASPGDLERQLRFDVSLGLADRVILATGSYVTRAHLNRIPDSIGVWRLRDGEREVIREPTPLDPEGWGVELGESRPLRTDVSPVPPSEKARKRCRIAERAYGKGWRLDPPACTHGRVGEAEDASVPYCSYYDRVVDPGECGSSCPGHEPAEPPEAGLATERDRHTPWIADPEGTKRRQADLDSFR